MELSPQQLKLKTFILHWLHGEPKEVQGYDIADATRRAGYGGNAFSALDYWEEKKDEPESSTI